MKKKICLIMLLCVFSCLNTKAVTYKHSSASPETIVDAVRHCLEVLEKAAAEQASIHQKLISEVNSITEETKKLCSEMKNLKEQKEATREISEIVALDNQINEYRENISKNKQNLTSIQEKIAENSNFALIALKACVESHADVDSKELVNRLAELPSAYYLKISLIAQQLLTTL